MKTRRIPLFVANWKLHNSVRDSLDYVNSIQRNCGPIADREVVIAGPFMALKDVYEQLTRPGFRVGAQNCFWEDAGAFTGEVSASMLAEVGCAYVILGHSERRRLFAETDDMVNLKIHASLRNGMVPILCVGEELSTREAGKTSDAVGAQVHRAIRGIDPKVAGKIVIAYEPIWAIGTGRSATPTQIQEVHVFIRGEIARIFGDSTAESIRMIYGGSVSASNICELMNEPDVDGALVGSASLKVESFAKIICFDRK